MPTPSQQLKANPYLTPQYLLTLSNHIQTLSSFFTQQSLPSLTPQYKSFLQSTFKNLSNNLTVFVDDQNMIISSIIAAKVQMEMFVAGKLYQLLERQTKPIAEILRFVIEGYSRNVGDYDELLIRERKRKVEVESEKNQRVMNNLKKQVVIKRDYVKQLEQRIRDLQDENSKIYQKIIDNAKTTISSTLIQTKLLTSSSQFMTPGRYSKLSVTPNPNPQSSPVQLKISHKQMSFKQVQQTILEILNLKRKKESISMKRSPMKSYIKYYFKHKFGLSDLCEEMRTNFLSALRYFLSVGWNSENNVKCGPQRPLLVLFQKLIEEQINEQYFWSEYLSKGLKVVKLFKRYLNQKEKIDLKELDRLYDGFQGISGTISNYSTNKILINQEERKDFELDEMDVRHILCNVYTKSKEIQTLQMIFAQIIGKDSNGSNNDNDYRQKQQENTILLSRNTASYAQKTVIPSKQLIAMILCYEIQTYSIRISQLTNTIKKHSQSSQFVAVNYAGLEKVILQLQIPEDKYLPYLRQNYQQLKDREFTYSEVVQIVQREMNGQGKSLVLQGQNNYSSSRKI